MHEYEHARASLQEGETGMSKLFPRRNCASQARLGACMLVGNGVAGSGLVGPPSVRFNHPRRSALLGGSYGLTMIELMVTLTIMAVLAAIGTPSLLSMIATQQVKTATFDLYASLTYARSEAIKRNAVVTIIPRGGNFGNGYDLQSGTAVLRSQLGTVGVTFTSPSGVDLAYGGDGRLTIPGQYQLELTSARNTSIDKRCLVISPAGRPSIRVDKNHDGNCVNG
jgi:type IV fimbrial biogenesis protein FimT